jgi:hypothetical protein
MSRKLLMVLYRQAFVILPVLILWVSCTDGGPTT